MRPRLSGEWRGLLEGLRRGLPVPAQRGFPGLDCPARQAVRPGGGSSVLREQELLFPHFGVEGRGDVRHPLFPEDGHGTPRRTARRRLREGPSRVIDLLTAHVDPG